MSEEDIQKVLPGENPLRFPADVSAEMTSQAASRRAALTRQQASLADYRESSVAHADPQQRVLGLVNSDLAETYFQLAQAIHEHQRLPGQTLENALEALPAIDLQVRIAKQISQFAQLAQRAAAPITGPSELASPLRKGSEQIDNLRPSTIEEDHLKTEAQSSECATSDLSARTRALPAPRPASAVPGRPVLPPKAAEAGAANRPRPK